jgi:hypothetical protein
VANIISNGNFADTTGWSAATTATIAANSNTLSVTGTGTNATISAYQNTSYALNVNNKYYFRFKVRVTNSSCASIRVSYDGTTAGSESTDLTLNSPVENEWYTRSVVDKVPANATGNVRFYLQHVYADAGTANGKVMEVQEVLAIDMGADASNPLFNLTAADMDKLFPAWFNGTIYV